MDFETPEEGYLAKIMVSAGQKDITVGKVFIIILLCFKFKYTYIYRCNVFNHTQGSSIKKLWRNQCDLALGEGQ